MSEQVYYWTVDILENNKWKEGSIRYASEFTARLNAQSLNIPLENIRLTKHKFDF